MIFSKGYLFPPSFLDLLETFNKPVERDALNMAIHRYMYRGELPVFTSMNLKRTWIGIFPYLKKSRNAALAKESEQSQDELGTISRESQDNLKTNSEQSQDIKDKGIRSNNKPPIIPQGGDLSGFEKFWQAYPLKKGKQAARRAFDRARKLTTLDNMLSAIRKQKGWEQWTRDNGKYIPHPAKWLNQGRWDDQSDVDTEPEKPAPPPRLEACPLCGSADFRQHGDYGICNACGKGFSWYGWKKIWKEDK